MLLKRKSLMRGLSFRKVGQWVYRHRHFWRTVGIIAGGLIAFILLVQLMFPGDRTTPWARNGSQQLGFHTKTELEQKLRELNSSTSVAIKTADHTYQTSTEKLGLRINEVATTMQAIDYPWWQRLIPGSLLVRLLQPEIHLIFHEDTQKLQDFATAAQKENYKPATNAAVQIQAETAIIEKEKDGVDYPANLVADAIRRNLFKVDVITLTPQILKPIRLEKNIQSLLSDVKKLLSAPPTLQLGNEKVSMSAATYGNLIAFTEDPNRNLHIELKTTAAEEYLQTILPKIYVAPGVTAITLVDSVEINRSEGASGRGIDTAKTIEMLQRSLSKPGESVTITVPLSTIAPKVIHHRNYTKTQGGLSALLKDLVAEKGNYGVAVIELNGRGWIANAEGDKKFITASTYKLYVAYAVLKKIESGEWQWSRIAHGDKTVEVCFEQMIVRSDNPCAEEMGKQIGWNSISNQMKSQGLKNTVFAVENFYSTANDYAHFLRKLYDGSLLAEASRDKLLDAMRRQIYRSGVPAGVGVPVANKVGFLDGLLHDAAIVEVPNNTYVVVILSNGSSWGNIADVAKRIHQHLN